MKSKTYLLISAVIFGLVCLGHLLRVIFGWPMVIGTYDGPRAVSWMAVVLTAGLVVWVMAMLSKEEHQSP